MARFSTSSTDAEVQGIADQGNSQARVFSAADRRVKAKAPAGSMTTRFTKTHVHVIPHDSKGAPGAPVSIPKSLTNYVGLTVSAAAPGLTELPEDGSFGWHHNTSSSAYYFAYNDAGTVVFLGLSGMAGTISDAQHGSRAGGTLHPDANGTTSGFMPAAAVTKLGNYPASCTTVANDSNAVQRNSGAINGTQYNVSGTKVVGAQGAAVADAGATLASTTAQLNTLLARLRAHGLIDT